MNYNIDELGFRRAKSVDGKELLGSFLEEDIQSGLNGCDILLRDLSDVEHGVRPPFSETGNAHHISIQPGKVSIEHLWLLPPVEPLELTMTDFRQALLEWRTFLVATSTG